MFEAERIARRAIFQGRVVDLSVDTVRLPNGTVCDLELVQHPGAAAVVPLDASGEVVLIRQYRYAAGGWLLEVPAGKLDPGEAPEACATREVEEETGLRTGRLTPMGWIWTTPGFTDERIWLYLATELEPSRASLEADEVLTVKRMPLQEALDAAAHGEIRDAKTICALLRVPRFLDQARAPRP